MSPETITAIFTGLTTLATGVLGAWNARQGRQLKALREEVGALTTWRSRALEYIANLVFVMRSEGLHPPEPPPELGLTVPPAPTPEREDR